MGGGPAVYNSVGPGAPPLTFGKGPSAACSQVVLLHGLLWLPGTSMMFVALSLLPVLPFFLPHAAAPCAFTVPHMHAAFHALYCRSLLRRAPMALAMLPSRYQTHLPCQELQPPGLAPSAQCVPPTLPSSSLAHPSAPPRWGVLAPDVT